MKYLHGHSRAMRHPLGDMQRTLGSPVNRKSLAYELSEVALSALATAGTEPPPLGLLYGADLTFIGELIDLGHEFATAGPDDPFGPPYGTATAKNGDILTCGPPGIEESTDKSAENVHPTTHSNQCGHPGCPRDRNYPVWNLSVVFVAKCVAMFGLVSVLSDMIGAGCPLVVLGLVLATFAAMLKGQRGTNIWKSVDDWYSLDKSSVTSCVLRLRAM